MITKKWLGLAMSLMGLLLILALIGVDLVGAGDYQGLGPLQRLALMISGAIVLIGLSLIPLGDRPA